MKLNFITAAAMAATLLVAATGCQKQSESEIHDTVVIQTKLTSGTPATKVTGGEDNITIAATCDWSCLLYTSDAADDSLHVTGHWKAKTGSPSNRHQAQRVSANPQSPHSLITPEKTAKALSNSKQAHTQALTHLRKPADNDN